MSCIIYSIEISLIPVIIGGTERAIRGTFFCVVFYMITKGS